MTGFPRPLAGKRVLDLSRYLPGPYCTRLLHVFGAEIVKVEHPVGGDPLRKISPALFEEFNRGKKSVTLDLGRDQARLIDLAAGVDAVVDGFRPGFLDRIGIGEEAIRARNPKVVWCAISSFGQTGPYRARATHDLATLAMAGYFSAPSSIHGRITRPNIRLADLEAGSKAAFSVAMALWNAEKTGTGASIDLSMFDAVASLSAPMAIALPDEPGPGMRDLWQVMADSDLYQTRDGRSLALATLEDKFWAAFAGAARDVEPALSAPIYADRAGRDRDKPTLAALIAKTVATLTLAEWEERLRAVDTCWGVVLEGKEVLADPHFIARRATSASGHVYFPAVIDGEREIECGSAPALGADNALLLEAASSSSQR